MTDNNQEIIGPATAKVLEQSSAEMGRGTTGRGGVKDQRSGQGGKHGEIKTGGKPPPIPNPNGPKKGG